MIFHLLLQNFFYFFIFLFWNTFRLIEKSFLQKNTGNSCKPPHLLIIFYLSIHLSYILFFLNWLKVSYRYDALLSRKTWVWNSQGRKTDTFFYDINTWSKSGNYSDTILVPNLHTFSKLHQFSNNVLYSNKQKSIWSRIQSKISCCRVSPSFFQLG